MRLKHAILILAHTNQEQINMLLSALDNERVDIYMHVDSKFREFDETAAERCLKKSNIYFLDRRDVRWGDVSLVCLELDMFKLALLHGEYVYFHLISGMDMPIKPINTFLDFCEKNKGYEFVNVENYCNRDNITLVHLLHKYQRPANRILYCASRIFGIISLNVQKILGVGRLRFKNISFHKGSNWVSLTYDAVKEITDNKDYFLNLYRYSSCADEIFIQTYLLASPKFKDKIYPNLHGNLRLVDWKRGYPYVFKYKDFDELKNSSLFWARKIDMRQDKELVCRIIKELL